MCDTRPRNEREDGAHEPKTENENGAAGSHEMREQHTFESGGEPSRERVHVAAVEKTKPCGIEAGKRSLKTSTNKIILTALWCSRVKMLSTVLSLLQRPVVTPMLNCFSNVWYIFEKRKPVGLIFGFFGARGLTDMRSPFL